MAEGATSEASSNGNSTTISPELEEKIVRQVEYYFGDKNFPRDRFLRQKAEEDDGWVALECLITFNRLKTLSADTEVIAKTLRKHSETGLVEVSEDNKKVRRLPSVPLPLDSADVRQEAKQRTVYCKGFPKDMKLDALEEFFRVYGKVVYIAMRRLPDRSFKGSVFVEFAKSEDVKSFLSTETLKYNEEELIKMSKEDYFKMKNVEREKHKMEEKKQKEEERKKIEEERKAKLEKEEEPLKLISGCALHLEGIGEQTSREDLKEIFGAHEPIAWVDFVKGNTEGQIRFSNEGGAKRAVDAVKDANDGKILIRGVEPTFRILEGEEEENYWKKVNEERLKAKQRKAHAGKRSHGGHGRGGYGGRGFGGRGQGRGKWRRDRIEEKSGASPAKKVKIEPGEQVKTEPGEEKKAGGTHVHFEEASEPPSKQIKTED